ncbi:protein ENHANCED DOWNY MILDEW 2-like [Cynara cardunculus var. scolymus]|uniref:protein ENHANCED DOWNY MILDEW 2-like n=1 Tax=Cynara cardunculus var. scolymus TaxID=59895 RepID=UPI000D62B043|nr:protein ENHANCED DOWNY MILDEW 2-like [Cynara cardunculus var. scolymus]
MASSDEEGEIFPHSVTAYQFLNYSNKPIPFSNLPIHWSDHHTGDSPPVYLLGTSDGDRQSVYKQVIGWKLELLHVMPQVYILSKGKSWIKLLKPKKSYEDIIKTVVIVIHGLHFVKRNLEATGDRILSHLMKTLSSYDVVEPLEQYLSNHVSLIRIAVAKDEDLAKSKYLERFLMEIENPGRRETFHEENQSRKKSKFIVDEDDIASDEDLDEEAEVLFDPVCAFCDNGGDVLPCEGQCLRSFHPTIEAGVDSCCESLGFAGASQYEAIPTLLCDNCKHQKHQCFGCGKLGSSDKCSVAEVFPCVSATCGHFYHPECVASLLCPFDETVSKKLESRIAAGESFTCPIHKCHRCKGGEDKEVHDLQFAVCRRCPRAYHRKCLPMKIAFERSADGTVLQRAWDDLLPKRILIYCMKHKILPSLLTPKRDHLLFPYIVRKRNQDGSRTKVLKVEISKAFGNLEVSETENTSQMVERRYSSVTFRDPAFEKGKSSLMYEKRPSLEENVSISRNPEYPSSRAQKKPAYREERFASKQVKKITVITPPSVDTNMEKRILRLMKDSASSFDFDEFIKDKKSRRTHEAYTPQTGLDKTITMGKVEASVKAVRTALKKLDDGCSVEDAKAVCEPNVLNQLIRWKKKLHVFLAPFLHGARYTSFGRHFTKVDKLKEIVDRLHWYVEDGDMIVDFCCGSNDFSCFMKEKLDSMGKKCSYKNYDLIVPKNTFNFEQRDWFSVPLDALPDGSHLVMGLNPPFGVQASLANKFIDHALKFKPKLLILIAPKETKRLDQKRSHYDLVWEEEEMLSGKSFYLPGSINAQDQTLDDWNTVSPPLSLWSHPDWTAKHQAVAEKHSHIVKQNQHEGGERVVSNYLMEENHDYYRDFSEYRDISTILDDVPEAPAGGSPPASANPSTIDDEDINVIPDTEIHIQETLDDTADMNASSDMDVSSPVTSSTNSQSGPRLNPPFIQPSHPEHYPGVDPPQYATNTSVPNESDVGSWYTQSGLDAFPSHRGQGDSVPTLIQPPSANSAYGHTIDPTYDQPDFTSEPDIWPPGTMPPDCKYG